MPTTPGSARVDRCRVAGGKSSRDIRTVNVYGVDAYWTRIPRHYADIQSRAAHVGSVVGKPGQHVSSGSSCSLVRCPGGFAMYEGQDLIQRHLPPRHKRQDRQTAIDVLGYLVLKRKEAAHLSRHPVNVFADRMATNPSGDELAGWLDRSRTLHACLPRCQGRYVC